MKSKNYIISLVVLIVFFTSCEKYNQVDNTGIVRTPYVLYTGGLDGHIHKTNDANYFQKFFPIDNTPIRQIIAADSNLLILKNNCYVSDDEGLAFNLTNANCLPFYDAFYKYFLPHQMLYDKSAKKVYLCSAVGVRESDDLGKTFSASPLPIVAQSITELENGDVYAIQDDANIFKRTGGTGAWNKVPIGAATLTPGNLYYLSSFKNTLIATNYTGIDGVFYSTNGGEDWANYTGVSGNGRNILFVNNPVGSNDLFMGRDSSGLFKLSGSATSFKASGVGIPWYAKIQYVQGKKIIFRNNQERYYLFCATDQGLYMSESNGDDWRLVRPGSYATLQ